MIYHSNSRLLQSILFRLADTIVTCDTSKCHVVQFLISVQDFGQKTSADTQIAVNSPLNAPQATRDLGMARADRSAAWLPREHAEARSMTPRSVSARVPPFPSWKWPSPPFRSRPPSVPLEYRGSNARYDQSQCFIITTTRHSLTLPTGNPRSFYPRSLELTKNKNADRREHDETFVLYFGALTVRRTR